MLSTIKQVNRKSPNKYAIGPQSAQPLSWGIRSQKVRRWNKKEGKINVGDCTL
jgi:hypothetical protein